MSIVVLVCVLLLFVCVVCVLFCLRVCNMMCASVAVLLVFSCCGKVRYCVCYVCVCVRLYFCILQQCS